MTYLCVRHILVRQIGIYSFLVGTPVLGCPVILHRKITLPTGNKQLFLYENSANVNIFGGHPGTGVPTMLIEGHTLNNHFTMYIARPSNDQIGRLMAV